MSEPTSFADLIRRVRGGDADAAAELVRNYEPAIRRAVRDLQQGDVLVIAGKGHEQGQVFADRTDPFDDVTESQTAIKELA